MRALTPWTPWRPGRHLSTLHRDIDDLFARFFGEDDRWWTAPFEGAAAPAIESFVRDGDLVVRADLPGIDPKNVELTVEGDRLTIKGERKAVNEEHGGYKEVRYGSFERTVSLPAGADPETVKAKYHDGVLEVTMKVPKGIAPKKVPIAIK